MITMNIGTVFLIGIIIFVLGFVISAFLSGSKTEELDIELRDQKILNNRKDQIINFYESQNKSNNSKVTDIVKERKSK